MTVLKWDELLNDARLVVDYATRAGRLSGNALPKAIAAMEQAPPKAATQKIASLVAALNSAVQAIAPMTLVDLRAGRSPFDARNQKVTRLLQVSLCVFTVLLTVGVAYFTNLLHQEDAALKALQQVQDAHISEKMHNALKIAQDETIFKKHDSVYDEYQRAIRELKDLQDKMLGSLTLLISADKSALWSFGGDFVYSGPLFTAAPSQSGDTTGAVGIPNGSAVAAETLKDRSAPIAEVEDVCNPKNANDASTFSSNYPAWLRNVIEDSIDEFCFSTKLGLDPNSLNFQSVSAFTYKIQANMALLNGWLLPFLYGLLGASVFLMRSLLDPHTPNLGSGAAILRIALGGIAGIIIGWFWVPATSKTADMATVTAVPFAIAFLTGFSIDILFSLLDRLNRTVTDAPVRTDHRTARGRAPA